MLTKVGATVGALVLFLLSYLTLSQTYHAHQLQKAKNEFSSVFSSSLASLPQESEQQNRMSQVQGLLSDPAHASESTILQLQMAASNSKSYAQSIRRVIDQIRMKQNEIASRYHVNPDDLISVPQALKLEQLSSTADGADQFAQFVEAQIPLVQKAISQGRRGENQSSSEQSRSNASNGVFKGSTAASYSYPPPYYPYWYPPYWAYSPWVYGPYWWVPLWYPWYGWGWGWGIGLGFGFWGGGWGIGFGLGYPLLPGISIGFFFGRPWWGMPWFSVANFNRTTIINNNTFINRTITSSTRNFNSFGTGWNRFGGQNSWVAHNFGQAYNTGLAQRNFAAQPFNSARNSSSFSRFSQPSAFSSRLGTSPVQRGASWGRWGGPNMSGYGRTFYHGGPAFHGYPALRGPIGGGQVGAFHGGGFRGGGGFHGGGGLHGGGFHGGGFHGGGGFHR
ncbi:hypothetical protein EM20IM_06540 [Candidatus Methylacidiphilum infernorum]|uniref:DUF3300 domain-containing protein n=1 Tax=Candidatus Methylacidiphilum infernorum TaxID=511746 RepID=A0ABX7PT74_9BACT|nr:hypothetical protein [Candidatus Methylacidiphilum infernorum]QSR86164.1 hypothetical protein EM20IM_06540 [Candidatus Methylacidiphilum infernorum]